jgi:hypothetical protein
MGTRDALMLATMRSLSPQGKGDWLTALIGYPASIMDEVLAKVATLFE